MMQLKNIIKNLLTKFKHIILGTYYNLTNKKANGNMDSNAQMNCVYACITRAMDLLYVITTKEVANTHKAGKETSVSHLLNLMS